MFTPFVTSKKKYVIWVMIITLVYSLFLSFPSRVLVRADSDWVVSTWAGKAGIAELVDGQGDAARFNSPLGMVFDGEGNLYIADSNNNVIRKITADGEVTTYAGTGEAKTVNGSLTEASFDAPAGLTFDDDGNLYVSELIGNVIRKISTDGIVSTYAGDGTAGYTDGDAVDAQFSSPKALAYYDDHLYVADSANHRVRLIASDGTVSTFVGNGTCGDTNGQGTNGEICQPAGLAFDGQNNLYVTDSHYGIIRIVDQEGNISTFYDEGDLHVGIGGYIATDALGTVYVANTDDGDIVQIDVSGQASHMAGGNGAGYADGSAEDAQFNHPSSVAINDLGELFIADSDNHVIRKISIPVTSVTIEGDLEEQEISIGGAVRYSATIAPATAKDVSLLWSSSDENVFVVDQEGNVYTVGAGTATLTVTSHDGEQSDSMEINVFGPFQGVKLEVDEFTMLATDTFKINSIVVLFSSDDLSLDWTSSDESKATVDADGVVTAIQAGTVTITATTQDGQFSDSAEIQINEALATDPPTPTPTPTPSPTATPVTIPIEVEDDSDSVLAVSGNILRTTSEDGIVTDEVRFDNEDIMTMIDAVLNNNKKDLKISLPDIQDQVSQTEIKLPENLFNQLEDNEINFEIETRNGTISIPSESLQNISEDIYFTLSPVKEEVDLASIRERAKANEAIITLVGKDNLTLIGRPLIIETNFQNRAVTLFIPFDDTQVSEEQLTNIAIYIEHSDGTQSFVSGEVKVIDGQTGVEFTTNKFSTFSLVSLDGADDYFDSLPTPTPTPLPPTGEGFDTEGWFNTFMIFLLLTLLGLLVYRRMNHN